MCLGTEAEAPPINIREVVETVVRVTDDSPSR
jgi:hypothetical protein